MTKSIIRYDLLQPLESKYGKHLDIPVGSPDLAVLHEIQKFASPKSYSLNIKTAELITRGFSIGETAKKICRSRDYVVSIIKSKELKVRPIFKYLVVDTNGSYYFIQVIAQCSFFGLVNAKQYGFVAAKRALSLKGKKLYKGNFHWFSLMTGDRYMLANEYKTVHVKR